MTDKPNQLDAEREKRDINKSNMSILVGYESSKSWGSALNTGHMGADKIDKAQIVFEYYDENGYIPTPKEVTERYGGN